MAGADGILLKGICKSFSLEAETIEVLRGVDLEIPRNSITVLLGQSGCGKTTLLRVTGGLEMPEKGEIWGSEGERMAFVFQEPRLMPWLRVKDNVAFGLKRKEIDREEIRQILEMVGLASFARAYPSQLSGGMQQRCAIARAYAYRPSFILMDEPFAALDYFTREQMQLELLAVREKMGGSILFVTHSIDEALILGDKIAILEEGRIKREIPVPLTRGHRSLMDDALIDLKKEVIRALKEERKENQAAFGPGKE